MITTTDTNTTTDTDTNTDTDTSSTTTTAPPAVIVDVAVSLDADNNPAESSSFLVGLYATGDLTWDKAGNVTGSVVWSELDEKGAAICETTYDATGTPYTGDCSDCDFAFESLAEPDDVVVETQGVQLYLDPMAFAALDGMHITFEDLPGAGGFRIYRRAR